MRDSDLALQFTRQSDGALVAAAHLGLPESSAPVTLAEQIVLNLDSAALLAGGPDPHTYGERLSAMVFHNQRLRSAFRRAREHARHRGEHLRVRICISPPDDALIAVRWELLHDPDDGLPLARHPQILTARALPSADLEPIRPATLTDLRALVVVAGPRDLADYRFPAIDIEAAVQSACGGLRALHPEIIARTHQRPATLAAIERGLRAAPHILTLVCHGAERAGESVLWLEQADGAAAPTPGRALVERIAALPQRPLLVVLNVCQSGGSGYAGHALAALGPQLARAGVAAVIAAQGALPAAMTETLLPALFDDLLRTGRIDHAMAAARAAVPDAAWWIPTLYMRPTDGVLWRVDAPGAQPTQGHALGASYAAAYTPVDANPHALAIPVQVRPGQRTRPFSQSDLPIDLTTDLEALLGLPPAPSEGPNDADPDLATLLDQHRRLVLNGAPGSGKSTLLRGLMQRLVEQWQRRTMRGEAARLPIFVPLREWRDPALSLPALLQTTLARWPALAAELPERLRTGQLVLILDGLNEIPALTRDEGSGVMVDQRVAAIAAIDADPQWRGVQCIVSCRCDAEAPGLAWPDLHVLPLDRAQVEAFAQASFSARPELARRFLKRVFGPAGGDGLRELVTSPTGVRLAVAHMQRAGALPDTPAELIHLILEHTLRAECARGAIDPAEAPALYERLGRMALRLIAQDLSTIDRSTAIEWACSPTAQAGPTLTGRLWQIAQSAGLVILEAGNVRFSSRLVQQYLAARHLQETGLDAANLAVLSQRRAAPIWAIWRWLEPDLAGRLQPFLDDPAAELRHYAVQCLALLNDPAQCAHLAAALNDTDADVRYSAAVALAHWNDRRAAAHLLAALRRPDPALRRASSLLLGRLREHLAEAGLAHLLGSDPVGEVRVAAAIALGMIGGARALPALTGALLDPHLPVRAAAAAALGALGNPEAISALQDTLIRDSAGVARAAASALTRLGEPAFQRLTDLLNRSGAIAQRAVLALGYWHTDAAATALLGALEHSEPPTVRRIVAALHEIGAPALLPLIEALQTGTAAQRCGAARALGKLADPRTIPHLLAALDDPHPQVCGHAALALGRFGAVVVDALLARLLTAQDQAGRYAAIALGELGAVGLPALAAALNDTRPDQRICAIAGLERTARRSAAAARNSAVQLLETARFDLMPSVRHAACHSYAGLAATI
jgi:HEAT repeat protein